MPDGLALISIGLALIPGMAARNSASFLTSSAAPLMRIWTGAITQPLQARAQARPWPACRGDARRHAGLRPRARPRGGCPACSRSGPRWPPRSPWWPGSVPRGWAAAGPRPASGMLTLIGSFRIGVLIGRGPRGLAAFAAPASCFGFVEFGFGHRGVHYLQLAR